MTDDAWAFDTEEFAGVPVLDSKPRRKSLVETYEDGLKARERQATGEFFFDLETIPDDTRTFPLEPLPPIPGETTEGLPDCQSLIATTVDNFRAALAKIPCPPAAWLEDLRKLEAEGKNRDGILKAIESAAGTRQRIIKQHADRRTLLATTPEYCRIVAMGGHTLGSTKSFLVDENGTEEELLELFWRLAQRAKTIVAYNGLSFDLPVIMARSAILGVLPTRLINTTPWKGEVVDPYHARFGGRSPGEGKPGKLKLLAPLYGIDVPAGDDDGSLVEELWRTDRARLRRYVESDVDVLVALYRKWKGFWF